LTDAAQARKTGRFFRGGNCVRLLRDPAVCRFGMIETEV